MLFSELNKQRTKFQFLNIKIVTPSTVAASTYKETKYKSHSMGCLNDFKETLIEKVFARDVLKTQIMGYGMGRWALRWWLCWHHSNKEAMQGRGVGIYIFTDPTCVTQFHVPGNFAKGFLICYCISMGWNHDPMCV